LLLLLSLFLLLLAPSTTSMINFYDVAITINRSFGCGTGWHVKSAWKMQNVEKLIKILTGWRKLLWQNYAPSEPKKIK